MKKIRIIPRLDIKGPNVIKGIHLEGLRVVGKPIELAKKYYEQGADEILYMDVVASLYDRESILEIIKETTSKGVFIPITVGGGVRKLEDIKNILRAGADKVAINTAAVKNPEFIRQAAEKFGSQCIVGSIEAKKKEIGWEIYIENGREKTGIDAIEWAKKLVELGAGELLVTSIDKEGTEEGYEYDLIEKIVSEVSVPVIACGGAGKVQDIENCLKRTKCDAVSMASVLHYNSESVENIKNYLDKKNFPVRLNYKTEDIIPSEKNKKMISIIDYELGNLFSVTKGFEKLGCSVKIINKPPEIINADFLVLPGVGAFSEGMNNLKEKNLIEPIKKYVNSGKPFLGICLGAQLLLSESEEFGKHLGLDIIQGKVVQFRIPKKEEKNYRIPHIGWNSILKNKKNVLLENIQDNSEFYFVHSFYLVPEDKKNILAKTDYYGEEFCSILNKGNVYGVQFHPEKSGEIGLKILNNFLRLR